MASAFPKELRLRKRSEFVRVQRSAQTRKAQGDLFVVLMLKHGQVTGLAGRVGITVSKKVGNAVCRNRVKRLVREYVRRDAGVIPAGVDVVVVGKPAAAGRTYDLVRRDLAEAEAVLRC